MKDGRIALPQPAFIPIILVSLRMGICQMKDFGFREYSPQGLVLTA